MGVHGIGGPGDDGGRFERLVIFEEPVFFKLQADEPDIGEPLTLGDPELGNGRDHVGRGHELLHEVDGQTPTFFLLDFKRGLGSFENRAGIFQAMPEPSPATPQAQAKFLAPPRLPVRPESGWRRPRRVRCSPRIFPVPPRG